MMHSWGNQFGKRTAWLLSYFLIYVYLNILAQSQILRNSLYSEKATKYDEMTKCFDASKYVFPNIIWRFRQILVAF